MWTFDDQRPSAEAICPLLDFFSHNGSGSRYVYAGGIRVRQTRGPRHPADDAADNVDAADDAADVDAAAVAAPAHANAAAVATLDDAYVAAATALANVATTAFVVVPAGAASTAC